MKTGLFILIAGIFCVLLNDSLLFLQIRRYFKRKIYSYLFWLHSLFFVACIVWYHLFIPTLKGPEAYFWVEKMHLYHLAVLYSQDFVYHCKCFLYLIEEG